MVDPSIETFLIGMGIICTAALLVGMFGLIAWMLTYLSVNIFTKTPK